MTTPLMPESSTWCINNTPESIQTLLILPLLFAFGWSCAWNEVHPRRQTDLLYRAAWYLISIAVVTTHAYWKYGQLVRLENQVYWQLAVCILACKYERDKMQSRVFSIQIHNSNAKNSFFCNVQSEKHWRMYPRQRIESTSKNDPGRIGFASGFVPRDWIRYSGFNPRDQIRGRIDLAVTPASAAMCILSDVYGVLNHVWNLDTIRR